MRDIGSTVAIEIAQREAVRRTLSVAKLDPRKLRSVSGIEEDGRPGGDIPDDNIWTAIGVQITG